MDDTTFPTPHGAKLQALLENKKLPASDLPRVEEAVDRYKAWRKALDTAEGKGSAFLEALLKATNEYKRFIELELIYKSENDFLYRQKGQLKLDNTILEEFLPRLVDTRLVPGLASVGHVIRGPQSCFAGLFMGPLVAPLNEGGIIVKTKDQDFTVGRKVFIKASKMPDFSEPGAVHTEINVAYFAAELKTNLDKTMFQEAEATARGLKQAVLGAEYLLLCEWLDMPPVDTRLTSIDEVILLRKAKRLGSQVRDEFATAAGRKKQLPVFQTHIDDHPLALDSFKRLVKRLNTAFPEAAAPDEESVLTRGYF